MIGWLLPTSPPVPLGSAEKGRRCRAGRGPEHLRPGRSYAKLHSSCDPGLCLALPLDGCCHLGEHQPRCIQRRLPFADLPPVCLMPTGRSIEVTPASQPPHRVVNTICTSHLCSWHGMTRWSCSTTLRYAVTIEVRGWRCPSEKMEDILYHQQAGLGISTQAVRTSAH